MKKALSIFILTIYKTIETNATVYLVVSGETINENGYFTLTVSLD